MSQLIRVIEEGSLSLLSAMGRVRCGVVVGKEFFVVGQYLIRSYHVRFVAGH